jgi:DMSO/TMAO reductase YedYZ molybdopterin-dependent catalytic subunit
LRKAFAKITATIAILSIFISFTYITIQPASGATVETENPDASEWQLTIKGLVANPTNLTWSEIVAMPKSTVNAALICVDAPNTPIAKGNWTGIKLRTLLETAEPSANAIKVGFGATDGYSTDLTVEAAMQDNIILAYEKGGVALNDLRLVVPGRWGYKWISHLTVIELVDYNFLGVWESKGYSDQAYASSTPSTDRFTELVPKASTPPRSATTPPPTSPSPPPLTSPAPSDQVTPAPENLESFSIPTEVLYAIVASVVAAVLVALLTFVRKRAK